MWKYQSPEILAVVRDMILENKAVLPKLRRKYLLKREKIEFKLISQKKSTLLEQ